MLPPGARRAPVPAARARRRRRGLARVLAGAHGAGDDGLAAARARRAAPDAAVRATAWLTEGRYKLAPGWYVAARYDRMLFSRVESSQGPIDWDAGLWRVEAGAGYSMRTERDAQGQLPVQPPRRRARDRRKPRGGAGRAVVLIRARGAGRRPAARRLPAYRRRSASRWPWSAGAWRSTGRRAAGAPAQRGGARRADRTRRAEPAPGRRVLRGGAARRVRRPRERARLARSAQRDVRPSPARHHGRHHGGLPEPRPHLSQRVLPLEGEALRSRALRGWRVQVGALRSARASCASSATSTRT